MTRICKFLGIQKFPMCNAKILSNSAFLDLQTKEMEAINPEAESTSNNDSNLETNLLLKPENGWRKCGWNLILRNEEYGPLPEDLADIITLGAIKDASEMIYKTGLVEKTPIIDCPSLVGPNKKKSFGFAEGFGLKLENMQHSGSFKIRGASYQFSKLQNIGEITKLVTISAGNYGRSFAFLAKELDLANKAKVFMPKTVNESRRSNIRAFGVKVDCTFPQSKLVKGVMDYQKEKDAVFLHPFDDPDVLIGHASAGLEILEQIPSVDIVLVCCGGGGFLAGITAAFRLSGNTHTKIYGVEHELASTMFDSLDKDEIVKMKNDPSCTICPGLSAPFPGNVPFKVFRAFGDGVILVNEDEIKRTVRLLYKTGLVVEPSGAAAVAAVLSNKVPDTAGKKVVAFVTGGNVSPLELDQILNPKCEVEEEKEEEEEEDIRTSYIRTK